MRKATLSDVTDIVDIHLSAFPDFNLSKLGRRFVAFLYRCYVVEDGADIFVQSSSSEKSNIAAFIVVVYVPSNFYARLRSRYFFQFCFLGIVGIFRNLRHFVSLFYVLLFGRKYGGEGNLHTFGFPLISSFAVLPAFHGKGFGRSLLQQVLKYLESKDVKGLYLTTDAVNNAATLRFYAANGFKVSERLFRRGGREMLLMTRRL